MIRTLPVVLLVATLATDAVVAQVAAPDAVAGTVTYRRGIALPPDAVVVVRLQDTTRTDAAARDIGQTTITTAGAQVPIPFRIEYDPAAIDPSHTYSVRAMITVGDRLQYTSTTQHPVLTHGAGNRVVVEVYMILPGAAETARPAVPLENTYWKLVAVGDTPAIAAPAAREASFMLHPADHRLSGSGGCNRLMGSYEAGSDTLKFAPGGTTMMACPEDLMQQESDFVSALKMTTGYTLTGDTLELRNGERVLARFMAQNSR